MFENVNSLSWIEVISVVYRHGYSYCAVAALTSLESLSFWHLSYLVILLVNSPLISGVFVGLDFMDYFLFPVLHRQLSKSLQLN